MTHVFADTTFYVALHNRRDALHAQAVQVAGMLGATIVTSEFVLIEVANFFKQPGFRQSFAEFDAALRVAPLTTVVSASAQWYARGLKLFASRNDQQWSLVDCISFEIMRERGIAEVLTADVDFEQAGFRMLLKA